MKKYIKLIGTVLSIVSIALIIYTISRMDFDFTKIDNIPLLIVSVFVGILISCASVFFLGFAWIRVVRFLSEREVSVGLGLSVYFKANIGKYLPGNVMQYVERNLYMSGNGLNQSEMVLASVSEIVGQLVAALMVGIVLSFSKLKLVFTTLLSTTWKMIIVSVAVLGCLTFLFFAFYPKSPIYKLIRRLFSVRFVLLFLSNILLYMISLLILGGSLSLIVGSMRNSWMSLNDFFEIITTYDIAWVAGFVIPGAPGGIGVREFVVSILTKDSSIFAYIVAATVIHRFVSIVGDVFMFLLGRVKKSSQKI